MLKKYFLFILLTIPVFTYGNDIDCHNAINTIETNYCINKELEMAEAELSRYLSRANERYVEQPTITAALAQSQHDWLIYRKSHCDAIYALWSDGTIRGAMFGDCMLKLIKERTHTIWTDYLTYMDSTSPLLPEPN